jgi:hypothetical protein
MLFLFSKLLAQPHCANFLSKFVASFSNQLFLLQIVYDSLDPLMKTIQFYCLQGMVTKTKNFDHLLVISGLVRCAKALMDYNI